MRRPSSRAVVASFLTLCFAMASIVGIISIVGGMVRRAEYQPYRDGIQTTATVTKRTEDGSNKHGAIYYFPELTFNTAQGETISFNHSCSSLSTGPVGSEVRVSYKTEDPTGARNLDSSCKWEWLFGLILGAVLTLIGGAPVLVAICSCILQLAQRSSVPAVTSEPPEFRAEIDSTTGVSEANVPTVWLVRDVS